MKFLLLPSPSCLLSGTSMGARRQRMPYLLKRWWSQQQGLALCFWLGVFLFLLSPASSFLPHPKLPPPSHQYHHALPPPPGHHDDSLQASFSSSPVGDPMVALRHHHLRHQTKQDATAMPFVMPQTAPKPKATTKRGRAIQVVTDIDDTIKSSGGWRLAGIPLGGIDTQYPRGDFYPGAFQFALELGRSGLPKGVTPQRVAVLTARAREFKFALELKPSHKVSRAFAATGVSNGFDGWGIGTVLYGSVLEWICQHRKGWRKFVNFEALKQMDRNGLLDYVLVGDTGELDQQAAEWIIDKYPDVIRAVFLHYVSDIRPLPPMPQEQTRKGVHIVFFRTYVGAALRAVELGLMMPEALEAVVTKAVVEFEMRQGKSTPDQWEDLRKDIEAAEVSVLGPYREKMMRKDAAAGLGVSPIAELWEQFIKNIFGEGVASSAAPPVREKVRVRRGG